MDIVQGCCVSTQWSVGEKVQKHSASGIILDGNGYVLTHASLFYKNIQDISEVKQSLFWKNLYNGEKVKDIDVKIYMGLKNIAIDSHVTHSNIVTSALHGSTVVNNRQIEVRQGLLQCFFQSKTLALALRDLLPPETWNIDTTDDRVEDDNDNNTMPNVHVHNVNGNKNEAEERNSLLHFLLPCFALLKVIDKISPFCGLPLQLSSSLRVGDSLEIVGTPFAEVNSAVFFNSHSRGMVSNLSGENNCLILTDARCLPGCEGAPVSSFHKNQRILTGIVLATLAWKNNEWIGLSFVGGLSVILNDLKNLPFQQIKTLPRPLQGCSNAGNGPRLEHFRSAIAAMCVATDWGSGVYIGHNCHQEGVILTCSHVLAKSGISKVKVTLGEADTVDGQVVYRTPPGKHLDIGLIKVPTLCPPYTFHVKDNWRLSVQEGEVVYVIGYAAFPHSTLKGPTITSGVVSKVVKFRGVPVMIQTTCAVHAGASGGVVIDNKGKMVGIVVCNSKDVASGANFPHVNMCVPSVLMRQAISHYMEEGDLEILNDLEITNRVVNSYWNLDNIQYDTSEESVKCKL